MTNVLTERELIGLMREEWESLLKDIQLEAGLKLTNKEGDVMLSSGLKLKHKESGLLYTVVSVSPKEVVLKTPEGDEFLVNQEEIPTYELA